ncbi:MAG TPA: tetratricopeptide repeat protein, partial [Thermoanaerobaculia bacterium]|nr:tetratricopeptide repeat protein [Thermoanaerobaculia bacterium]
LDQHLQDVAATTQLFAQADFQIAEKAVPAVNKLPPIADCANTEALTAAQAAGDQVVAARSAAQLSWVTGYEQARPADGEKWARLAQSIAEGARGGPLLRSELLVQLAATRASERRFQEALDLSLEALSLAEKASPGLPRIPSILNDAAQYFDQLGRENEALSYALRSLQIREKTLPAGHPDFAATYNTLGNIYNSLHRNQDAIAAFERMVDINRRQYGPKHWWVAGGLVGLATAHQYVGHLDVALRYDREALAIFEECFGPEHSYDAMTLVNMGEVLMLQNQPAAALASYQRALAIQEKTLGAKNPALGNSLAGISRALPKLGRAREAIPAAERALALFESQPGVPAQLSQTRFFLANALWEGGGDRGRAIRLARQARESLAADQQVEIVKQIDDWLRQRGLSR